MELVATDSVLEFVSTRSRDGTEFRVGTFENLRAIAVVQVSQHGSSRVRTPT